MKAQIFSGNDKDFMFWTPAEDDVVLIGPEQRAFPLPQQPLPIRAHICEGSRPSDDELGSGIYEYLRRYPDCEGGYSLADLLSNVYPHYIMDLASQIVMIEEKNVDAPFLRRKIAGLKILVLIDPQYELLYQIARNYYDLTTIFTELPSCRSHLLAAREYLQRSLIIFPDNPAALNLLAQIEAWFGLYDEAVVHWQKAALLVDEPTRSALQARVDQAETSVAHPPLIDELEDFGESLKLIGSGQFRQALIILERLQDAGRIMDEWPTPELHYLLGHCRESLHDFSGAILAYHQALQFDAEFLPAKEGLDRVSQGRP